MRRIDLTGSPLDRRTLRTAVPRSGTGAVAANAVRPVLDDVARRGLAAVTEYTEKFDGVKPADPRVPAARLREAADSLDAPVREALVESIRRARIVHEAQCTDDVTADVDAGATVTERRRPVDRVGLYAPGGLAVYPSSVVMNVVPAQAAGVESLALASPPRPDFGGYPHPTILAAAELLGVTEVYAMGGAQAVAAFAYGYEATSSAGPLEPVDVITGPGNAYVAAAKQAVSGDVGIDALAGPTEIAVLADGGADAALVAADLISQAEHDTAAAAVLVTPSAALADAVDGELDDLVARTRHAERVETALSGDQSATILVDSLDAGVAVINSYAAEHVEVVTADAHAAAAGIVNAGAIFIGAYAPVSLGDYLAGSNHVLPTSGSARYASGLSVQTFLKSTHVVEYSAEALQTVASGIEALAEAEDLPAHGEAVSARFGGH